MPPPMSLRRLPPPPKRRANRPHPLSSLAPRAARLLLVAALVPALAACGSAGADAPGGVSAGEAKALDEAAEMLDQRRLPPQALPPEAAPAEMTGDTGGQSGQ